jgi:ribonuclease E
MEAPGADLVDAAIGETRALILEGGRPAYLHIHRWSDAGKRAGLGDVFEARIARRDSRLRGAFVDLGLSAEMGFMPLAAGAPVMAEGARLKVEVVRERVRGKSPLVKPTQKPPGLQGAPSAKGADARDRIDAAIEAGLAPEAPVPGGGRLIIEPTAALVAIDVDAGDRQGEKDAERFALTLNCAAGLEAVRQLRLRGLGGIAAIDFVSLKRRASIAALEETMKSALEGDAWGATVGRVSRYGVLELARAQRRTPLHEILHDPVGEETAETAALALLRAMEREHASARGKVIRADVSPAIESWLNADHIAWRAALTARIGVRWSITGKPGLAPSAYQIVAE